jgi:exonuclease III
MIADCDPARPLTVRIVTSQEIKTAPDAFPVAELAGAGYGPTAGHWTAASSRLRACGIDRGYRKGTKPSDHAPLLVDLAGAGAG